MVFFFFGGMDVVNLLGYWVGSNVVLRPKKKSSAGLSVGNLF